MRLLAAVSVALLLPLTGCGSSAARQDDRLEVAAAFYPLEHLVRRIGGDRVTVSGLAKPGAEPHDVELTPQQVAQVSDADLVVYLRGFQPAVDAAVDQEASDAALDVAAVASLEQGFVPLEEGELREDEKGADPHIWRDPERYAALAGAVSERLGRVDPAGAGAYRGRAEALQAELATLDRDLTAGLARCERRDLVTSHNAFGYLARAYRLEQIAITGLTPEQEPSPGRLAAVIRLARERKVTTVFFEGLVSPKVAQSLAREVGARAEVLDPLESAPATGDYDTVMRANLATLRTALDCS